MKMFSCYIFSFLVCSCTLNARPLQVLNVVSTLGEEAHYNIYKAELFGTSQQNHEFKCIVVSLLLLALVVFLIRRNLLLKKSEEKLNLLLSERELHYNAMMEAEGKERLQMVRTLHDNIGQQLSAAKLNISALQSYSKNINPADKIMIQKAVDLLNNSVKGVRSTAHTILPNTLIQSGLVSALLEMINQSNSSGNTKINLDISGNIKRFPQCNEVILYRVLRELVNNSLIHAKASEINLQLIQHESDLTIIVQDNGVGFVLENTKNLGMGLGLKCVQAQILFLRASIFFDSQPSKGSTVSIEIPLSFV